MNVPLHSALVRLTIFPSLKRRPSDTSLGTFILVLGRELRYLSFIDIFSDLLPEITLEPAQNRPLKRKIDLMYRTIARQVIARGSNESACVGVIIDREDIEQCRFSLLLSIIKADRTKSISS